MRSFRLAPALNFLVAILALSGTITAQNGTQDSKLEIACRAYPRTTESFKRKLWDGYEVSLGPVRDDESTDDVCTAAIYNREGKVVYRRILTVTAIPKSSSRPTRAAEWAAAGNTT